MDKQYYYKAMNKDMKCRDFQFKVGKIYTIDSKELELFSDRVFHFCEKLEDTRTYYNSSTDRHFLIEVLGDIITEGNKSGSNKIRIVREINRDEIAEHIQDENSLNAKLFLAKYTTIIKKIEKIVKDKDWRIRRAVASNPNTPVYLLKELAQDVEDEVLEAVAKNLNTPVYILENLAKADDLFVRYEVASNPNTPVYLLKELEKDNVLKFIM